MGPQFRSSLAARFWYRICPEVIGKMSARAAVI